MCIQCYYKKDRDPATKHIQSVLQVAFANMGIPPPPIGHGPCNEGYHYPHFIDGETEPQRDYMIWGKVCEMRSWESKTPTLVFPSMKRRGWPLAALITC